MVEYPDPISGSVPKSVYILPNNVCMNEREVSSLHQQEVLGMSQQSSSSTLKKLSAVVVTLTMLAALSGLAVAQPAGTLSDALGAGKLSLDMRYRMEMVSEDGLTEDATASTARIRLSYLTESFQEFSGFMEFEAVTAMGDENYNNTANANVNYPIVADREDAELNQAYISYSGIENANIMLGRQRLVLDNGRFIGNVGWRQNEQTFDAGAIRIEASDDVSMFYAHVENVNTVFGEHHPTPALADIDVAAELINVSINTEPGKLTGYMYMLEFADALTSSHQNLGVRFAGERVMGPLASALYSIEWAKQSSYKDGLSSIDATYYHLNAGAELQTTTIMAGLEKLGGDGTWSFITPLATLHDFNGWADMFLSTPINGLKDTYLSVGGSFTGTRWTASYHDYSSDAGSAHYGSELGFQVNHTFTEAYTIQFKYSSYSADTFGTDTRKIWTSMTIKI